MSGGKKLWYAPNQFDTYDKTEIAAVTECLERGWLAPGKITEEFEHAIAALFHKKFAVMVNSGSSANLLAVLAAGLQKGDKVVTPACTFATSVAPLVQAGLEVVFCDVELGTYVPSLAQVTSKITAETRAVLVPDLLGSRFDWAGLRQFVESSALFAGRSKPVLIEDACDTILDSTPSDFATTSFYASHIITAGGGGGMVMCNTEKARDMLLTYRDWGRIGNNSEDMSERFNYFITPEIPYDFKFLYSVVGYNMKSTEMNAAFGLSVVKTKLPRFAEARVRNFAEFLRLMSHSKCFMLPYNIGPDEVAERLPGLLADKTSFVHMQWLAFPLLIKTSYPRVKLLTHLEDNGVQTRVIMAGNILRHPAYEHLAQGAGGENHPDRFPNSDTIMKSGFLLGMHQGLELEDVARLAKLLLDYEQAHMINFQP